MRGKLVGIALALAMALLTGSAWAQNITIRVGHVLAPSEATHIVALEVAKRVSERTNGRVEIRVFPGAQLGPPRDVYEQARLGAPVMGHIDPGFLALFGVPDFAIMNGPFLFDNVDQINRLVASPLVAEWKRTVRQNGLHVIALNWYFGERHIISNRAFPTPTDLRGVKMRVPPNPVWIETFRTLGAVPVTLQWVEVYSGLQQGVVDAAEAPLSTLYGSKLHEVARTVTLTGHFKAVSGWVIGERFWRTLPRDVQQILTEEFQRGGERMTRMTIEGQEGFRRKLEAAGVRFVTPNVAAYAEASQGFYANFPGWTPGLHARVRQIIEGR
jgi:tripartite ATP-independent transporter DctP family solute receptor